MSSSTCAAIENDGFGHARTMLISCGANAGQYQPNPGSASCELNKSEWRLNLGTAPSQSDGRGDAVGAREGTSV